MTKKAIDYRLEAIPVMIKYYKRQQRAKKRARKKGVQLESAAQLSANNETKDSLSVISVILSDRYERLFRNYGLNSRSSLNREFMLRVLAWALVGDERPGRKISKWTTDKEQKLAALFESLKLSRPKAKNSDIFRWIAKLDEFPDATPSSLKQAYQRFKSRHTLGAS